MCGITGWISFDRELARHRETLDDMTDTLSDRGPDDRGIWVDGHAALGHRRLAVIDLLGGRQPMTVSTSMGHVVIVHSGEVYNFLELRDQLTARGHNFTTHSDTEVILHGYLEWGESVASHLNGMYAFAIWDPRAQKLVMVRDRIGVKPLFYYPTSDGAVFASEPKAIFANPLASRAVNADSLRQLFSGINTPGEAIWTGMHEVEAGKIVVVNPEGIRSSSYWSLESRPHTDDFETSISNVRALLEDITQRQLIADVPRCTLLSGGLDSSVITALAARHLGQQGTALRTFTVDFSAHSADHLRDARFARDVAFKSQTVHHERILDSSDLADPAIRAKVIRAREIPVGLGDRDTSLYLLFKDIRRYSTVALSGEAADEVFGGYGVIFDDDASSSETFPWLSWYHGPYGNIFTEDLTRSLAISDYIKEEYFSATKAVTRVANESSQDFRKRLISYLFLTRFVPFLLQRKDRLSMAVGLEVRVPFCDHRLIEYVYNMPWGFRYFGGREKSLLREAAGQLLPESVRRRDKSPYPATRDGAYDSALRGSMAEIIATPSHRVFDLIDHTWAREAVEQSAPLTSWSSRRGLERALDLAVWLDMYSPSVSLS